MSPSSHCNKSRKSWTCSTAGVTTVGPLLTAVANVCPATSDWVTMMPAMFMPRASATVVTAAELAMPAADTAVVLTIPALCYIHKNTRLISDNSLHAKHVNLPYEGAVIKSPQPRKCCH